MYFRAWTKQQPPNQTVLGEEYIPVNALLLAGMEFERWIDYTNGSARSNGMNEGDLIESPGYVIESLLRDWVFTERNRRIDSTSATNKAVISGAVHGLGLLTGVDDYYNNAIWYNHATGHKTYISDYNGDTKEVTLASADGSGLMAAGNYITVTNIQGDNLIDTTSFDSLGNTTNGLRKDYKLAVSLKEFQTAKEIINGICENFLIFLFKSGTKYKVATLEKKASSDGTFTNPLKSNGVPQIQTWLGSLDSYYSDFKFTHFNEYAKNEYIHTMVCNANGSTSGLGSTFETLCKSATQQYKQGVRLFEREFPYIFNGMDSLPTTTTTMHNIAKLLIKFYTRLRLFVDWYGDFKNHMAYEIGDQVVINYSGAIPTGLNNSTYFLITNKTLETVNGIPTVRFTLMETFEL